MNFREKPIKFYASGWAPPANDDLDLSKKLHPALQDDPRYKPSDVFDARRTTRTRSNKFSTCTITDRKKTIMSSKEARIEPKFPMDRYTDDEAVDDDDVYNGNFDDIPTMNEIREVTIKEKVTTSTANQRAANANPRSYRSNSSGSAAAFLESIRTGRRTDQIKRYAGPGAMIEQSGLSGGKSDAVKSTVSDSAANKAVVPAIARDYEKTFDTSVPSYNFETASVAADSFSDSASVFAARNGQIKEITEAGDKYLKLQSKLSEFSIFCEKKDLAEPASYPDLIKFDDNSSDKSPEATVCTAVPITPLTCKSLLDLEDLDLFENENKLEENDEKVKEVSWGVAGVKKLASEKEVEWGEAEDSGKIFDEQKADINNLVPSLIEKITEPKKSVHSTTSINAVETQTDAFDEVYESSSSLAATDAFTKKVAKTLLYPSCRGNLQGIISIPMDRGQFEPLKIQIYEVTINPYNFSMIHLISYWIVLNAYTLL